MTGSISVRRTAAAREWLNLALLLALMGLCAWLLQRVGGWPHLPSSLPSWRVVAITLQGSYLPGTALVYALTTAGWILWLYFAFCIVLNAAVVVGDRLGPGGLWLEALRELSARVTLPIIRRTVEAALVATLFVNVGARVVPVALAASPSPAAVVVSPSAGDAEPQAEHAPEQGQTAGIEYTVQPADTLWSIASCFYGSGAEYPRLVEANAGRVMPDGRTFARAGVIQPGWKLRIPLPSPVIDDSGGEVKYIVQPGDSLSDIAARLLGNEDRWQELYAANRNVARLPDGRVLTAPDLIWPGLPITLPAAAPAKPRVQITPAPVTNTAPAPPQQPPVEQAAQPSASPEAPVSAAPSVAAEPTTVAPPAALAANRPPLTLLYGLAGGLAAAGGGAAAAIARRRWARRSLDEPLPLPDEDTPALVGGFAEADLARGLTHRLQGDELEAPVVIAGQVARFFAGRGLTSVDVLAVRSAGERAAVLLESSLHDQPHIERSIRDLERIFQCTAEVRPTVDRDVLLSLEHIKIAKLLSLGWDFTRAPLLIPVALSPERETLYVNWPKAGPILLAGANGSDVETVFVSLLASLAARRPPEALRFVALGGQQTLPAPLAELPHLPRGLIDQASADDVRRAVDDIKVELAARREASADDAARPLVLLAIGELAELEATLQPVIETLAEDGGSYGMLLLAATSHPERMQESLIREFPTQIVLRMLDEDQSVRLLGQPDAVDLGGGGDLLIRVQGRTAMRGRGFHVGAEHLDELRRLMAEVANATPQPAVAVPAQSDLAEFPDEEPELEPAAGVSIARISDEAAGVVTEEPQSDAEALQAEPVDGKEVAEAEGPAEVEERVEPDDSIDVRDERLVEARVCRDVIPEPDGHALEQQALPPAPGRASASPELVMAEVNARMAKRGAAAGGLPAGATSTGPDRLIDIRCFGEFTVSHAGQVLSPQRNMKSWEVLAFIASQPNGMVAKEKLLALIWPEVGFEEADNRLDQVLFKLRSTVARQVPAADRRFVRIEGGFCKLDAELVSCDVQQFAMLCQKATQPDRAAAKHAAEQARQLYRGDLLVEMPYPWLHERSESGLSLQERYRNDYYGLTAELARLYREDGHPELAVPMYKELLRREPTLEDVVRSLYRCYAAMGDRAALVQEHRHLQEALSDMFNGDPLAKPQPETLAAYQEALTRLREQAAGSTELAASA
jgi:DNA-binding SARP family transcriptional activator/LysM repeat protein